MGDTFSGKKLELRGEERCNRHSRELAKRWPSCWLLPWVFWVTASGLALHSFLHLSCFFLLVFMVDKVQDSVGLSMLFPVASITDSSVKLDLSKCLLKGRRNEPQHSCTSFAYGNSSHHKWVNILVWEWVSHLKSGSIGQWDGSVGRGAFWQAWQNEFKAQDPQGGRGEPTLTSCPLSSTHML